MSGQFRLTIFKICQHQIIIKNSFEPVKRCQNIYADKLYKRPRGKGLVGPKTFQPSLQMYFSIFFVTVPINKWYNPCNLIQKDIKRKY